MVVTEVFGESCVELDWDVKFGDREYKAVYSEDGKYYIYPRYEEPLKTNIKLMPDGLEKTYGVRWGITMNHDIREESENDLYLEKNVMILRNDDEFYLDHQGLEHALWLISTFDRHPLNLYSYGFSEDCIGRKVWWRGQPAIVKEYIYDQACIILKPDGKEMFDIPNEFKTTRDDQKAMGSVKTTIFDDQIWWWR